MSKIIETNFNHLHLNVPDNQLCTHVVQDHVQCAHKCSVAVLDRHCSGGAVRRCNTLITPMYIHTIGILFFVSLSVDIVWLCCGAFITFRESFDKCECMNAKL